MSPRLWSIFALLLAATPSSIVAAADKAPSVLAVFTIEDARPKRQRLNQRKVDALSNLLRSQLAAGGAYQIVPGGEMQAVLRDRKADSYQACYDEACQIEIGKELAAEKSLATKITRIGSKCIITSTLYDLGRGTTETSADYKGGCQEDALITALDEIVVQLRGGQRSAGFARTLVKIGQIDNDQDLRVDLKGASFSGLDIAYLEILQNAKRLEKQKAKPKACSDGWSKLVDYKGKNPLKAQAKKKVEFWQKAAVLHERFSADAKKLSKILALDDDVLPAAQKKQTEQEFLLAYAPYAKTLAQLGADFAWQQLSSGAFCPKRATIKKTVKTKGDKKTVTEACTLNGKKHGLKVVSMPSGKRTDTEYVLGKRQGRVTHWLGKKKTNEGWYDRGRLQGRWVQWHDNGIKKRETQYLSGQKQGTERNWTNAGVKKRECPYTKGKLQGLCRYWYPTGEKKTESLYSKGKLQGQQNGWAKNGTKISLRSYTKGKEQGPSYRWYDNGQKSSETNYKAGKREGAYRSWHKTGTKKETGANIAGKRHGIINHWYETGEKRWRVNYIKGQREGEFIAWRTNGQVWEKGRYHLGKKDARWVIFTDAGQMTSEISWVQGKKQGPSRAWYDNGKPKWARAYKAGLRHGKFKAWNDEGKLLGEFSMQDGTGTWSQWHKSGRKQAEGRYVSNKKHGKWTHWYKSGRKKYERTYQAGVQTGPYRRWLKSGQIVSQGAVRKGKLHGTWTYWSKSGDKLGTNQYDMGTGTSKSWWTPGQLRSQGRSVSGSQDGLWNYWRKDGTKQEDITFAKGKRQGAYTSFRADGSKNWQGQYQAAKRHGTWVQRSPGGKAFGEIEFTNGTGTRKEWHDSGQLASTGPYKNGKRHGKWSYWFENGNKSRADVWIEGSQIGPFSVWHENGNISYKGHRLASGYDGTYEWFFESGKKKGTTEYREGKTEGQRIQWFENGQKKWQGNYRRGLREGSWTRWTSDGTTLEVLMFDAGAGTYKDWDDETGKLITETVYVAKGRTLSSKTWNGTGGKPKKVSQYDKETHQQVGLWQSWDDDAKLCCEVADYSLPCPKIVLWESSGATVSEYLETTNKLRKCQSLCNRWKSTVRQRCENAPVGE